MNGFKKSFTKSLKSKDLSIWVPVILFFAIASFFVYCIHTMEQNNGSEASDILKEAVIKSAVHCYAIEGSYPEDVTYLEENYGLKYNHKNFTVHYTSIGSNIMPDIFIVRSVDDEFIP